METTINKTAEQREDIVTARDFHDLFVKNFENDLPNFKVYQEVEAQEYLGHGAGAVYTSDIKIPTMTEKEQFKKGLKGMSAGLIMGMVWIESEINPNGITGAYDIGRTFTIHIAFKAHARLTQRRWEDIEIIKFYEYSRDMQDVIDKFREWVDGRFATFVRDIADKNFSWQKSRWGRL